jgi:phage shock protein PspC (stress-responsive transcriptional regulator)
MCLAHLGFEDEFMTNPTIPDQAAELWRTRPVRLPDQGPVAGVAAGIGYRYRIDPVIVRVAFAVATVFGGTGIALYIACWLTFTKPGEQFSPADSLFGRGRTGDTNTAAVVLAVALAISLVALGVGLGGSGPVSIALMLGGWWLLHQRTPVPPPMPTLPTTTATSPPPQWGPYSVLPKQYVAAERPNEPVDLQKKPPSWDPLGVAPFAWDLPDPSAPPPTASKPEKKKSRFTSVVIGLAIIAAAVTAAIGSGSDVNPVRIAAVALAVVAAGLIVGAFLRRGHGLLICATPLAGFVILASAVDSSGTDNAPVGDQDFTPTTMTQLMPTYTSSLGDLTLDLTELDLTADRSVTITSGAGDVEVKVPETMNVRAVCTSGLGDTDCLNGDTAQTSGPLLTLTIDNSLGDVEVHRD